MYFFWNAPFLSYTDGLPFLYLFVGVYELSLKSFCMFTLHCDLFGISELSEFFELFLYCLWTFSGFLDFHYTWVRLWHCYTLCILEPLYRGVLKTPPPLCVVFLKGCCLLLTVEIIFGLVLLYFLFLYSVVWSVSVVFSAKLCCLVCFCIVFSVKLIGLMPVLCHFWLFCVLWFLWWGYIFSLYYGGAVRCGLFFIG